MPRPPATSSAMSLYALLRETNNPFIEAMLSSPLWA